MIRYAAASYNWWRDPCGDAFSESTRAEPGPSCKADLSIRWQLVLHDHGTAEPGHFEKADVFFAFIMVLVLFELQCWNLWSLTSVFVFVQTTALLHRSWIIFGHLALGRYTITVVNQGLTVNSDGGEFHYSHSQSDMERCITGTWPLAGTLIRLTIGLSSWFSTGDWPVRMLSRIGFA